MAGTLTFNIPPEVVKGTPTTLSFTNSINKPSAGVSFTWSAPGFTPSTGTGDTLRVTPPTTAGTYCPITVTAKATKFRDTTFTTLVRVQDGLNMAGTLTFTSPKQGVKSQSITFSNPQGITTPDKGITYTWEAPHFDPPSATGNNYTAISSATGTFRVKLTASANNYISTSVVKDISVGDVVPMTGGLTITVPERVTVSEGTTFTVINDFTDPTSGITFEWEAPLFSPKTHTGTSFPTVAPDMEGPAVVSVTAKAKGYQDKKINVTVDVKGKWKSGVPFNIEGPGSTPKDMGATFTANSGLTAGTASITYEWSAPGFNPNSHTGETFAAVPVSTGTYTITLKAKAPGYADNTVTKTVDVVELEMDELTGINASSHTFTTGQNNITFTPITAPLRSPAVYTWSTTGSTYTSTGNSYTPTLPSTEGNYVIMLLVKATGYKEKQVTFPYTATCHPMEVSFTSSRTALLTNDETTLNVNPPSPPVSGISYTWVIPTGFDVKSGTGDLTTPSVTIKTPNQSSNEAVPIKLTATAVNYCPATYSKNVTVKECYDLPNPPVITSSISPNNDGYVTVPSRRIVTFSTPDITPRRAGGAVTYNWNFDQDPMPFTPSSLTGNSSSFVTTAPAPNDGTYTLALQVKADGYCDSDPVTQKVTIASYITSLRGRLYIKEAIKTTNPDLSNQDSTIWIAQNQSATLTAIYIPASGEDNLDLRWKWSWLDGKNVLHSLPGDKNTIGFTPTGEVDDQLLTVEVYDFNGGAPISKTYRYTVQPCGYNKPDLHININYRCGKTTGAKNDKAFIRDPEDDKIYPVVKIRTKWWFADNLKKETGSYVSPASFGLAPELGLYYITGSAGICPAGWELPDTGDWNDLKTIKEGYPADQFKLLATNSVSGGSTYNGSAWAEHDNTPGSDYYGFSAKPAGYISGSSPATQGLRAYFLPLTGNDIYYLGRMAVELKSDGILGSTSIVPSSFYTARCVRSE
jgi:uncharacterized protein (TIGR02145 family)